MASSPPSLPVTPRTASPSPFDDDLNPTSPAPSQDDAPAIPNQPDADADADGHWGPASSPGASPQLSHCEAVNKPPKGKERAKKTPLRLLDLPVDILKEIIHQVGTLGPR